MRKLLPLFLGAALVGVLALLWRGGGSSPGAEPPGAAPHGDAAALPEAAEWTGGEGALGRGEARDGLRLRVLDAAGKPAEATLHLLQDGEALRLHAVGGEAQIHPAPQSLSALAEAGGLWSEAAHWSAEAPGSWELVLRLEGERACSLTVRASIAGAGPAGGARILVLDSMPATGWERMFEGMELRASDIREAPPSAAAAVETPPAGDRPRPSAESLARASLLRESWTADEAGVARLPGLRAGTWAFEVRAPGCPPAFFERTLAAGEEASEELVLQRGARVAGRVSGPGDRPIGGAEVGLWPVPSGDMQWFNPLEDFRRYGRLPASIPAELRGACDAEGRFAIAVVPAGEWLVLAIAPGLRPGESAPLQTLADADADAGEIRLTRGHRLAVRARDAGGAPVAGAEVSWRGGETVLGMLTAGSKPARTGADGAVMLEALPSAEIEVRVEHEDFARERRDFALLAGTEAIEKSWELTLRGGAAFSGVVLAGGAPLGEVRLRLVPPREDGKLLAAVFDTEQIASSGPDGRFRFDRLPPGAWRMIAEHDEYARLSTEPFELFEGENPEQILQLLEGATILATVLDDAGAPVPGAAVLAQELVDYQAENAVAGPDGVARFAHLPPGGWRLMRVDGLAATTLENDRLDLRFVFLELEEGETAEVTLGGPVARADLSGRLTSGGQPLAKHTVVLIGNGGVRSERSDEDGRYRMDGVELGDYLLNVASGFGGGSSWFGALELRQSGAVTHDVELPSAAVEVRVVDAGSGAPAPGVPVNLRPEDASSVSGGSFQHSDAEGIARFALLSPGRYLAAVGNLAMPMLGGGESLGSVLIEGIVVASPDAGVQRVEARLPAPARLRVRVSGPDGAYLAGAHLHCLSETGQALNFFSTKGSNSKGVVELGGLPPGPQRFLVRHPQLGSAEFTVNLQAGELSKHEVSVGEGVRLEITVTDADGAPLSGVLAVAMEPGGRPLFYFTIEESQTVNQAWFSGGAQPVGPLAPGRYLIRLHRPGYPAVDHEVTVAPAPPVQSLRLRFTAPE